MTDVLLTGENQDTEREDYVKPQEGAIYLQTWERGLGQIFTHGPQEKPTLPAPWSQTSSLQNYEEVSFYY